MDIVLNDNLFGTKVIHQGNIFVIDSFCSEPVIFLKPTDKGEPVTCGISSPTAKNLELFKEPKTIKGIINDTILSREQIQKINKCPIQDIDYEILEFHWDRLKLNIIENLEKAKLI